MTKTCCVKGCNNKHYGKGYCRKHHWQISKYGRITDNDFKNNFTIWFQEVHIDLKNRYGDFIAQTIIDLDDWNTVQNYTWRFNTNGYARSGSTNSIYLHQLIINPQDKLFIDHINGNRLDNRKSNLRVCTDQQNKMNHKKQENNTSGCSGVVYRKDTNKWTVRIQVNYKIINLGCYESLEEAIKVRKQAEIEYFGDFRRKEGDDVDE